MNLSDPPRRDCWTSLGELVDAVGSPALQLVTATTDRDRPVRSTILHDPHDELLANPRTLLLAAAMTPGDLSGVLASAARLGYCGVVIKARGGDLEPLAAAATRADIALVRAADDMPWRHLDALLLSVLASVRMDGELVTGPGDELFALANAAAAVIGGSVAIEDLERQVLAYSSRADQRIDELRRQGILDRRVPAMDRHLAQYSAVLAAPGVVRFDDDEVETPRAAIAVRAGDRPLGTIWAIEGVNGLSAPGHRALTDTAQLAALHLLRRLDAGALSIQTRETALHHALDGKLSVAEIEFRLGLAAGTALVLMAFRVEPDVYEDPGTVIALGTGLARFLAVHRADSTVATTSSAVYVLLTRADPATAQRLATAAAATLPPQLAARLVVGISDPTTHPERIPELRGWVDDIVRTTLTNPGAPNIATLAQVRERVFLLRVLDAVDRDPSMRHPAIAGLAGYDESHRASLTDTLSAWLDAGCDVTTAAREAGVHANTLRYRLGRIEELFGVELDDPDTRLCLWIQLRAARTDRPPAARSGTRGR
jgi:hypothetical protein